MKRIVIAVYAVIAALSGGVAAPENLPAREAVGTPRLYVLDCGTIINNRPEDYGLTREEVQNSNMADMCFLIVHPKGSLLWETGLSDRLVGRPLYENLFSHYGLLKFNTLVGQLADVGYTPASIDYLCMSHLHFDHSGNGNLFTHSTWLVPREEWKSVFDNPKPESGSVAGLGDFDRLKGAKTVFVPENYDVFKDGSVIIRQAFGHTPGHSVLDVTLHNTGHILLVGDLYHYPEELRLHRMPEDEATQSATPASRTRIEALARDEHAQIWLTHDMDLFRRARREPAYYD
jgi:glyoxylase-like metal-dependent hydrolase (beta-lactamase superfamily II)